MCNNGRTKDALTLFSRHQGVQRHPRRLTGRGIWWRRGFGRSPELRKVHCPRPFRTSRATGGGGCSSSWLASCGRAWRTCSGRAAGPITWPLHQCPARARPGLVEGPFSLWDPLRGPKVKLTRLPRSPFEIPVALPHAPGTPSGPSKNRSKRKTKILKSAQFFKQKSSPGKLLPIQDPPKRAPLDLIHFPKSLLGNF